jgi:chemotaxis protein CheC
MSQIKDETLSQPSVELISAGINNAINGLAQMVGGEIQVKDFTVRNVKVKEISNIFGGPEVTLVGVYLQVSGFADGHMIVVYEPSIAFQLIDMLMGQEQGSTTDLSEMEQSVLGEVGNIMGSFFLNVLADGTGTCLQPSPPAVMMDMAGAMLDVLLAQVLEKGDEAYIAETNFSMSDQKVNGKFVVLPVPNIFIS